MNGEYPKEHFKNDNYIRKTETHLDSHAVAYTTLSPNELKPRKVCVRGIQPYADPKLIIDDLKEHNFTADRAAMLKIRKTEKLMPIYLENLFPRANFEEVYQIHELLSKSYYRSI